MKTLLFLGTSLLVCAELLAQTTSTSILGTVTDATGAAVSGVRVTAKNVGTNVQSVTLTTGSGDYTLPLLDVGEYQVTVEEPGFKPAKSPIDIFGISLLAIGMSMGPRL